MRRLIAGIAVGVILAAMTGVLGAPAASAACPNEAFRTGPSALLAECRAYEMVTPLDKEGGIGILRGAPARVSLSGDGIFFNSTSAYAGAEGNPLYNPYVAERVGDAWVTRPIIVPQSIKDNSLVRPTAALSPDLGLAVEASEEAVAPGAIPGGSNLYLRDTRTGASTLIAARPSANDFERFWGGPGSAYPFLAATPDWSNILIGLVPEPEPQFTPVPMDIYEFREGALHLAVTEAFVGSERAGQIATDATPNLISADGSRFYYQKEKVLYLHQLGREPLLVSEDGKGNPLTEAVFVGATPNGETAFFLYNHSLYRFEASAAPGERITDLTPPVPGELTEETPSMAAWSNEEGTFVYLATGRYLTPDAGHRKADESGEHPGADLYVWHGGPGQPGELHYIGKTEVGSEENLPATDLSQDGRYFGFESRGEITPDAVEGSAENCPNVEPSGASYRCKNVFLYSFDANRVACVTCTGSPPTADSQLGDGENSREYTVNLPRTVTDNGMVFFETSAALLSRDVNGAVDVYAWRDGQTQLVSTGTDPAPSTFVGASADGSNVFFRTEGRLVGQDVDSAADLYDARVDGGLPQDGPEPPARCAEDCRTRSGSGSPSEAPATGAVHGARNVAGACLALRAKARAATRLSRALARRAKRAEGTRAKALRQKSARQARLAKGLSRRAGSCTGGGR